MRTVAPVFVAALLLGVSLPLHAQPASFVMAACGADTTTVAQVTLPHNALARNAARVDALKEGDYVRIWVNHDGTHYLLNLPADVTARR